MKNAIDDIDITITGGHNPFHAYNDPYGQLTLGNISLPLPEGHVQGEMILAEMNVSDFELTKMNLDHDSFKNEVKKQLANKIAEQLLNNKLIEFTKIEDIHTGNTKFKARAFLAPDDKVREIRRNQR
jgi:phosphoribosylformylglycinamidine (FGAM) synthase PurS component